MLMLTDTERQTIQTILDDFNRDEITIDGFAIKLREIKSWTAHTTYDG